MRRKRLAGMACLGLFVAQFFALTVEMLDELPTSPQPAAAAFAEGAAESSASHLPAPAPFPPPQTPPQRPLPAAFPAPQEGTALQQRIVDTNYRFVPSS